MNQIETLYVYFEDLKIGELLRNSEMVYSFTYSTEWCKHSKSFPLSLAMPLQTEPFGNRVTLSFFENLLPEGWAREALEKSQQIQGTFELLKKYGEDCAGAIIISNESVSPYTKQNSELAKIDLNKIYQAIDQKQSVVEVIAEQDPGYLSIAGAQDKFTTVYKNGHFFLPTNGRPTTHIVKTPIFRSGVKDSVFNEYYCMSLARAVGLNIPNCMVIEDGLHSLFVISRYDRYVDNSGVVHRLHQQDFCQAQGIISEKKYETKGGPSIKDNYDLIKSKVTIRKRAKALISLIDWVAFNLLIGNNDSHSKNLSLLLIDNKIELAPFYDLKSTAIYPKLNRNFSFLIGGRNQVSRIGKKQLAILNEQLGLKAGTVADRVLTMQDKMLVQKDIIATEILQNFKAAKIVDRISKLISERCKSLVQQGICN